MNMPNQEVLEAQLNSFHPESRRAALEALASRYGLRGTASDNINLHIHSFFSYNAFGWSPSRIAWEAAKRGLYGVGLCDFDALDGQAEATLQRLDEAAHLACLRGLAPVHPQRPADDDPVDLLLRDERGERGEIGLQCGAVKGGQALRDDAQGIADGDPDAAVAHVEGEGSAQPDFRAFALLADVGPALGSSVGGASSRGEAAR